MRYIRSVVFCLIFLVVFSFIGHASSEPNKEILLSDEEKILLIADVHQYSAEKLGLKPTSNCSVLNLNSKTYLYEFYAPALKIPYSYRQTFDEPCQDKFVYYAVAAATTEYPEALLYRSSADIIFTVFHEIWHDQVELDQVIEEPMGTVFGYAAAMVYVKEKFSGQPNLYRWLEEDFQRFLEFSEVINNIWEKLDSLYVDYRSGKISKEVALKKKQEILAAADDTFVEVFGYRAFFELNNASIGFNMTYTRYFPLMYEVYFKISEGKNDLESLRVIILIFKAIHPTMTIEEVVNFLNGLFEKK